MKSLFKQLRAIAQYPQKPVNAGHRIQKILSSRYSSIPLALNLLIFIPALLTLRPTPAKAVLGTGSFGQRYSADLRGDIVLIGNTLTTCTSGTTCDNILNGTTTGNNQTAGITAARVDVDSSTSTTNSSMAGLRLPAGSTVVRAYLYYQSSQAGTTQPPQDNQVLFGRTSPGVAATSNDYQTVTATAIENFSTSATRGFTAVADVTNIVNSLGSGDYWVGNLDGYTNLGSWSGWSLVVVFRNPTQNIRNLSVNDGSAVVGVLSNISSQDVTISGFKAPNTGIFDVKIGAVAYDGDRGSADNGYQINNINITDSQNTATDAFNSSITDMGAFYPPTWGRNPNHSNNLSVDIDLLSAPTPATIANGATTAKFTVASSAETLYLQALTTSIEIAAISGTLYRDNNNNGTFNTGEPTLPAGITVRLLNPTDNSVITTTTTAADGTYTFTRINDGNYKVQVDPTDTDIPADLRLVTSNDLAVLVAGAPVNNQSFGFVPAADLSLSKTVNNASPNIGENVTFTVTVNNAGPSSATGVSVADLLPAGLTFISATPSQGTYSDTTGVWTVGTVASATSTTLQIVATVATAGAKTNTAQVSASAQTDPDSTPNNNVAGEDDQASVTVTPPTADLSITKTDSPDPVIAGANLTYAIAVTNNGAATATNVTMSDPLPSGTTFQSITTPPGWTCTTPAVGSNGTVSCTNPSLAVGTVNFTLVVKVAPNTANNSTLSNTATVSSTTSDTNTSNNFSSQTTTVQQSADLRLTKLSTPASPAVGGTFDYTITVTNDGPSIATNVRVRDTLPVGIGYVLNTPSQGTYDSVVTQVWDVGTLNPGASATLVIRAIRSDASITVNTAEVIAADQPDPDSPHNNQVAGEDDQSSVTVPSQSVDLAVSKTVNNPTPNVGDNVTFTITATNLTASTTATNVGLSDILPPGLTYQSNTASTGTYNTSTGVWSIASLNSGTPATLTITATVLTSGAKTNTAQLSALDQTDSNVNNNSSSATVTPTSIPPNLLLVKRITAINGVDVTGFQDGVNTPGDPNNVGTKAAEDNNAFWPTPNTTSLRGAINSSAIAPAISLKPGDEVEYTIYFLNSGAAQADNVSVCDFVPANQTYVGTGYNSSSISADAGGFAGSNYGIALQSAYGATPVKATNASDGDRAQFLTSGFPASCTGTNSGQGAVVVNIGNVPNATGAGVPANSYGFIRFKAKID